MRIPGGNRSIYLYEFCSKRLTPAGGCQIDERQSLLLFLLPTLPRVPKQNASRFSSLLIPVSKHVHEICLQKIMCRRSLEEEEGEEEKEGEGEEDGGEEQEREEESGS